MPKVVYLTKVEVARREINAAIRMFFNNTDPIAVHAVVAGGLQVISDLADKKGTSVGIEGFIGLIKVEKRDEFRSLMRKPQNFIKHADKRGDEKAILKYIPDTIQVYLFMAAQAYETYTGKSTPEMKGFMTWFTIKYPDTLTDDGYKKQVLSYRTAFGDMKDGDKSMFVEMIDSLRQSKQVSSERMDYS